MERNLFDLDNARYLNKKELIGTFIPTDAFSRILSPKNQIIIGSRGSGKTALLKMISHDHLSHFENKIAQDAINSKLYVGVHISTKTKFIGGLKNKDWQDDGQKEYHFRWMLNIASCMALLDTIKSCLDVYYLDKQERIAKEIDVISTINQMWFPNEEQFYTIHDFGQKLEDTLFLKSRQLLEDKIYGSLSKTIPVGITFDMELFDPIIQAINIVGRKLDFNEKTSWFICIDEIEILEEFHHRILNSYMRANSGNIFFKFTTLPYCHYTLDTNTNVPLELRHDVQYVYIDQDASFKYKATEGEYNALKLFRARAKISKPEFATFNFQTLFGESQLLDRFSFEFEKHVNLGNFQEVINSNWMLTLFDRYAGEPTRTRGLSYLKNNDLTKFGNEIGRKMKGLLILKDAYAKTKHGNHGETIYSGAKIVINVGDANPRKLLGIFNEMIKTFDRLPKHLREKGLKRYDLRKNREKPPVIPYTYQNQVLVSLADRELNKSRIEKNLGDSLFEFMNTVGEYMKSYIHDKELTTEQISSIEVKQTIDPVTWEVIKRAVQKGLLYPNVNANNPDDMPLMDGTFHLSFMLSPKFKILPRRGDSRNLGSILPTQLKFVFDA